MEKSIRAKVKRMLSLIIDETLIRNKFSLLLKFNPQTMKDITKKYTNGEITIVWKPSLCSHSRQCFNGLPEVFDPGQRPWTRPENSSTEKIVEQIKKCPSGALSFYYNQPAPDGPEENQVCLMEITKNGPLIYHGKVLIRNAQGEETLKENKTAFCRCGASSNKPYCDGSHSKVAFEG